MGARILLILIFLSCAYIYIYIIARMLRSWVGCGGADTLEYQGKWVWWNRFFL